MVGEAAVVLNAVGFDLSFIYFTHIEGFIFISIRSSSKQVFTVRHILVTVYINDYFSCQTHPNVDKKLFTAESVIGLKNPEKSFPLNNDVGVLKWRLQTTDESLIPLTSKCPPV